MVIIPEKTQAVMRVFLFGGAHLDITTINAGISRPC